MREPKFVPGERVILDSTSSPELNGEAVVLDAWYTSAYVDDTPAKMCWVYDLTIPHGLQRGIDGPHPGWCEKALRKLPPETPATFDASIWVPNKESVK